MNGVESIAAERARQIAEEGFNTENDAGYIKGELVRAAICYLLVRSRLSGMALSLGMTMFEHLWPFSKEWWKPKSRREDLIRAGALIAAELDRMDDAK